MPGHYTVKQWEDRETEWREALNGVSKYWMRDDKLAFPLSRTARAVVTLSGNIGDDEWDALLAHLAFYRQWYGGEAERVSGQTFFDDMKEAIVEGKKMNAPWLEEFGPKV